MNRSLHRGWSAIVVLGLVLAAGCGDGEGEATRFERVDAAAIPDELREPRPGTYAVTMEPAGTWHVERPPERFVAFHGTEADIVLALGRIDGLIAMGEPDRRRFEDLDRVFYRQLPGLDVQTARIRALPIQQLDEERLLSLDPDAILKDPRYAARYGNWSPETMARVTRRTGPFFGNSLIGSDQDQLGPPYRRYSLDEAFAIYARLFQREEHYRRFAAVRDDLLQRIRRDLPPVEQRPRICMINRGSNPAQGLFYLVDLAAESGGAGVRQYRDLGLQQCYDAERHALGEWGRCDYETLAAIDPPVLIVLQGVIASTDPEAFHQQWVRPMAEHPIGRRLQAVRNGKVIPGGSLRQGPVVHLFQLEMAAQQFFPERFGTWRWGRAPDRPLFDRAAVAAIIRGEGLP